MKPTVATLGAAALLSAVALPASLLPGPAEAAGIERVVPSTRALFKEGNYVEFGLSYVRPDLSGSGAILPPQLSPTGTALPFEGRTGNLLEDYWSFSLAYKGDITDRISFLLTLDDPWGADTDYGQGSFPAAFSYAGTRADLDSLALTGLLAYDVTPQAKLYAGLRVQRMEATAAIPFIGPSAGLPGYTVDASTEWGVGYVIGGSYEIPQYAARVSLTYYSAIETEHDTDEFELFDTRTDIETPQQVNLEFQTGVAADTLLFGSVRWVDWSEFAIRPPAYVQATTSAAAPEGRALVDYEEDWWTYTLGVGRRFTDQWSGALSVAYEPATDTELTTLGPIDGRTSLTAAATYTVGAVELTGGLTYGWLGEAENVLQTEYEDGDFVGVGVRVGYSF